MKLLPKSPAGNDPEAQKAAKGSYIEFMKNGKYKENTMGFENSGTFKVSGTHVTMTGDPIGPAKSEPEKCEFDKGKGTLTFSPGPHKIVYIRANK